MRQTTFTVMGSVKDTLFDNKLVKVSTGEYNKQKIYQCIVKYATPKQGIYPHEIVKSVDISPKPTQPPKGTN
jgi:hypothetical protein